MRQKLHSREIEKVLLPFYCSYVERGVALNNQKLNAQILLRHKDALAAL